MSLFNRLGFDLGDARCSAPGVLEGHEDRAVLLGGDSDEDAHAMHAALQPQVRHCHWHRTAREAFSFVNRELVHDFEFQEVQLFFLFRPACRLDQHQTSSTGPAQNCLPDEEGA